MKNVLKKMRIVTMLNTYGRDHLVAKFIVASVVACLITGAQVSEMPWSIALNLAAVYIWFFGINPVAYIVEWVLKHPHLHNKL